jgi:hypothetical protein
MRSPRGSLQIRSEAGCQRAEAVEFRPSGPGLGSRPGRCGGFVHALDESFRGVGKIAGGVATQPGKGAGAAKAQG